MIIIDVIALFIFFSLCCYTVFQIYITASSSRGHLIDIEKRNYSIKFDQNLNVIIYSRNNSATIINLIESLKKQEYNKERYSINVILDNCEDNTAKLLEIVGGARLWRINTDIKPIGRGKAIAWLLERILSSENTNAFVFLNADCSVRVDFLSKINTAIYENPVIIGETVSLNKFPGIFTSIVYFKNKLKEKVYKHGRHYAALSNLIDSDVFAVRQEILEKIPFSISDNGFEEYEYSFKLSKNKVNMAYCSQITVYKQFIETFSSFITKEYRNLHKKAVTLRNNIQSIFKEINFQSAELFLSLIYPSDFLFIALNLWLYHLASKKTGLFSEIITPKIVLIALGVYLITRFFATVNVRATLIDYKNALIEFMLTPITYIAVIFQLFKLKFNIKIKLPKLNFKNFEQKKQGICATITDGKKELLCNLEIRQTKDYYQIIFIFKDKKMASSKCSTSDLALAEIIEKLKAHNFALKVCLNCGYFDENKDLKEKTSGEQGFCLFDNINKGSKAQEYTYIWNTCSNIIPAQARDYIQKQLTDKNV